jgi:hypothetical protein
LDGFRGEMVEDLAAEEGTICDGYMGVHWTFAFIALHELNIVMDVILGIIVDI